MGHYSKENKNGTSFIWSQTQRPPKAPPAPCRRQNGPILHKKSLYFILWVFSNFKLVFVQLVLSIFTFTWILGFRISNLANYGTATMQIIRIQPVQYVSLLIFSPETKDILTVFKHCDDNHESNGCVSLRHKKPCPKFFICPEVRSRGCRLTPGSTTVWHMQNIFTGFRTQ